MYNKCIAKSSHKFNQLLTLPYLYLENMSINGNVSVEKIARVVYSVYRVPCTLTHLALSLVLMDRSIHEQMVI